MKFCIIWVNMIVDCLFLKNRVIGKVDMLPGTGELEKKNEGNVLAKISGLKYWRCCYEER